MRRIYRFTAFLFILSLVSLPEVYAYTNNNQTMYVSNEVLSLSSIVFWIIVGIEILIVEYLVLTQKKRRKRKNEFEDGTPLTLSDDTNNKTDDDDDFKVIKVNKDGTKDLLLYQKSFSAKLSLGD